MENFMTLTKPRSLDPLPAHIRLLSEAEMGHLKGISKFRRCVTCRSTDITQPNTFTWVDGNTYLCNCREQYKLWLWLSYAGLGLRYMQYTWKDLHVYPDVHAQLNDYLSNFDEYAFRGLGFVLHSPQRGTGKTLIASLLFKELIKRGHGGFFTTFADMIDTFSAGWKDPESQRWFDSRVRHAEVLIIDDIGREAEYRRAIADDMLDSVVRSRAYHQRPTIITTNFSRDQLQDRYSPNIVSLLEESFIFCEVSGEDRRESVRLRLLDEAQRKIVRPVTLL
jgi:DNA replication protein DnaC